MTATAEAIEHLEAALALLKAGDQLDAPPLDRVEKLGKVAHLHLAHIEQHGSMTVADSRKIRRELSGTKSKMRSTANLFGIKDSGALLYREVEFGTRTKPDQPVRLTEEGVRIAKEWRKLHPEG